MNKNNLYFKALCRVFLIFVKLFLKEKFFTTEVRLSFNAAHTKTSLKIETNLP